MMVRFRDALLLLGVALAVAVGVLAGGIALGALEGGEEEDRAETAVPAEVAPRAAGAATAAAGPVARLIRVDGIGSASAVPDEVTIQLGVITIDENPSPAIAANNDAMQAVMGVVIAMGVADRDIATAEYNLWVEQVYGPEGPTGEVRYHLTNQIRFKLRDTAKVGAMLDQALAAGANTVSSVIFGVADLKALRSQARDEAVVDAKAKAEQLAARLGLSLGDIREVVETGAAPPEPPFAGQGAGGAGPAPIAGGEFGVTTTVQVAFDIRP